MVVLYNLATQLWVHQATSNWLKKLTHTFLLNIKSFVKNFSAQLS